MLTPQEVGEKAFAKAAFGGYSMPQVDEFLDVLTADYGVLYSENAVLKSKLKVLVDTVEEYRSTEEAMRKALMSAQRMADELIQSAEEQKRSILEETEQMARAKMASIRDERIAEEYRLAEAQRAVLDFSAQVRATYQRGIEFVNGLDTICPTPVTPTEVPSTQGESAQVAEDIEENVQRILDQAIADVAATKAAEDEAIKEEHPTPAEEREMAEEDVDFSTLEFGQNYPLK